MKAVQFFSDEYLEQCRKMKPADVVEFIENFRALHMGKHKSRLISLKVPEPLLALFKTRAVQAGIPYQTQIKKLMEKWATNRDSTAGQTSKK